MMSVEDSAYFGFAVAHVVFKAAYNGESFNVYVMLDALAYANVDQVKNSIIKNRVLIANFAMDLIAKRNEERNRPSITNMILADMILAAARGE
jgi:hypothetical protein